MDAWRNAQKTAFRALSDRIYIAADVHKLGLVKSYLSIDSNMHGGMKDFEEAAARMGVLVNEVIALAKKD